MNKCSQFNIGERRRYAPDGFMQSKRRNINFEMLVLFEKYIFLG